MLNNWIFKNGLTQTNCVSFPYAYRAMYNAVNKAIESGRRYDDIVKQMSIISPIKDVHGDKRIYSYATATEMAKTNGLLTPAGEINSREFKRNVLPSTGK